MNATPVPDVVPMLPKTIACTMTAVPTRPVIALILRYLTARSDSHEPNTAVIAFSSWSKGSSGNAVPVCFLKISR